MIARNHFNKESKEGYDACLHSVRRSDNPYLPAGSVPALDWLRGWDMAARELKGRFDSIVNHRIRRLKKDMVP